MNDTSTQTPLQQLIAVSSQRHTKRLLDEAEAAQQAIQLQYEEDRSSLEAILVLYLGEAVVALGHFEPNPVNKNQAQFVLQDQGEQIVVFVDMEIHERYLYVVHPIRDRKYPLPVPIDLAFRDRVLHDIGLMLQEATDPIPF